MKLTDKTRWQYSLQPSYKLINDVLQRDEWISVISEILPNRKADYIELGCAPGTYTAALVKDKPWSVYGIDYSDDADLFTQTLHIVGKNAILYREDLFNFSMPQKYDIVASYGLVEHFRGSSFEEIMALHDQYTKEDGYIVIAVPNFTGAPYVFHYIFDRPDLDNHNIDTMQPNTIATWLREKGYDILFNDYVGVMRLWGNTGWRSSWLSAKCVAAFAVGLSKLALLVDKLGISLRGRSWSPYLLVIAQRRTSAYTMNES